ncbi:MAG: hypothetical protein WBP26_03590 [Candidatus Saccharimonadales bacterium]
MHRTITLIIGLVIAGSLIGFLVISAFMQGGVSNFADCKDRGYPIQESYPEVCRTPSGKTFTNPDQKV